MSDTPRTDAAVVSAEYIRREMDYYAHKFVLADHMRDVERELAAARNELAIVKDDFDFAIEQRDKTRNDALEEAAKICDEYANVGVVGARICAAAICATKEFRAHMKEMHEFIAENRRLIKLSEGAKC
jgi:adenylosuccinate lyase